MRLNGIAIGLMTGLLAAPALAQTAIEQQQEDMLSSVVQIEEEMALRSSGRTSTVRIAQTGDRNSTEVTQNGRRNFAAVSVRGDGNAQRREPDGLVTGIVQNGSGNYSAVTVIGDYNFFRLDQDGAANVALISQTGGGLLDGNALTLVQDGFNNRAISLQVGDGNTGSIEQDGNGNSAFLLQDGDSNNSMITQRGDGLYAKSLQIGVGTDPVVITQMNTGAPAVTVTHRAP